MSVTTSLGNVKYLPANAGRAFAHLGSSLVFKDEPDDNGNALFLFECRMPPSHGVPPHTERNHEAFYVLEGTLDIDAAGEHYHLTPGAFLSIPPGVLHALRNPGPVWLRALMLTSPGSQHVRFFETLGEPIEDPLNPPQPSGPPDFARLMAVAKECGMEFQAS
jgi:mannose-6-phosphate isomerase-like protein (cupin superfamily)